MAFSPHVLVSIYVAALAALVYITWFGMEPVKKTVKQKQTRARAQIAFESAHEEFRRFKLHFSKSFETVEEEKVHFQTFVTNVNYIREHNKKYRQGKASFYLGINRFSDLEWKDSGAYKGLLREKTKEVNSYNGRFIEPHFLTLPKEIDWRKLGYVTEVKDQGQCGACWAFSATGALEGQHFRIRKQLVTVSEQQLIDCSINQGNKGCKGGLPDQAFEYVRGNGGIESEGDYPYETNKLELISPQQNGECRKGNGKMQVTCTGYIDITRGSEDDLQKVVASIGPISVAIDASHKSFQAYKGGVYHEERCSPEDLDHAVLVVGYGVDEEEGEYWLVKNSWGPEWGEDGYIRMARNKENMCGIATNASYPTM